MINKKIKKFLSVALILLMPTGGMICLADNKCQDDRIKVTPLDPNKCENFNVLQYMSRKSLDLMCTDTSKLGTIKKVFMGAKDVVKFLLEMAPGAISVASSIMDLRNKKGNSKLLREAMSADICKTLQDLSDKNNKSGIIIASRQLMHNGEAYSLAGDYSVQCPKP